MTNRSNHTEDPSRHSHLDEDPDTIDLLEIGVVLASRWKTIVCAPIAVAIVVYGITWLMPPIFSAQSSFLPPQQQQSAAALALSNLGALAGLGGGSGVKSPADQYIGFMQSVTITDRIIDRFDLIKVYDAKYRSDARKELAQNATFALGKKDGIITVTVDDEDPKRAAEMANAYVEELQRFSSTIAVTEAQQRRVFFEHQLQETKNRLTAAQKELESTGFTEGALRAEPKAAAENYARLQAEVTAAEVRLQTMRGYLNDGALELRQAQDQLRALRGQLARLEDVKGSGAMSDYVGRYREFKYQETLFELFSRQYELARVDEAREGALIQVVDTASPPERRSRPQRVLTAAVAAIAAFALLIAGILGRHSLRRARSNPEREAKLSRLKASLQR